MLSSLALIPVLPKSSAGSNGVLSATALNVLATLDSNGHLADLVDQRNWTVLQNCIEAFIPPAVWFNLTVYDENMTPVNNVAICSGSAISDHIEAADYLCASKGGTYAVYNVRLQLAGLD
jgi:hypothetical protein